MIITAIIAEYNPFHLGHKYHIEQARKLTNADIVMVIMSGNYVQRGEPAIFDKHFRADVALENGADIVLELPYPYSSSSAEFFAEASINILNKLSCIDYLCFGSECEELSLLYDVAKVLVDEPSEFKLELKGQLKNGLTYPKARHFALMKVLKDDKYEEVLLTPNNILGIEYMKSLLRLGSSIKPVCVKRIISDYHHNENNNPYYSASSIRNNFNLGNINYSELSDISNSYKHDNLYPITLKDFDAILACELYKNADHLSNYFDINSDLADRIINNLDKYTGFAEFIEILKTKNNNYTSISRGLLHLILDTGTTDMELYRKHGYADYIRVLKFSDNALPIFKLIEKNSSMSIITKLSNAPDILDTLPAFNKDLFNKAILSDNIYRLVLQNKYKKTFPNEYQKQIKKTAGFTT